MNALDAGRTPPGKVRILFERLTAVCRKSLRGNGFLFEWKTSS